MVPLEVVNNYIQLAQAVRGQARQQHQRRMLVLSGSAGWCRYLAQAILVAFSEERIHWVGKPYAAVETLNNQQAKGLLGGECSLLVYDAHSGFNPDAFAAASGTICGGGTLLLLTPPLLEWPSGNDAHSSVAHHQRGESHRRFIQYFINHLTSSEGVVLCTQGEELPTLLLIEPEVAPSVSTPNPYLTHDQKLAVEAIHHVVQGHRCRPLVITSDRGRGKSGALGLAAAQLLQQGVKRIVVTAPSRQAVDSVFTQAKSLLNISELKGNALHWQGCVLQFIAPDQLLSSMEEAALLLVDEAAAIPVGILQSLLARYSRTVFSSTIHGYEGSGRGFTIRFQKHLDEVAPGWQRFHLKQPIRWADDDPLEAFLFRSLCLNAEPDRLSHPVALLPDECSIRLVDRDELLNDLPLLRALFGLLVNAHYRTSPSDLEILLDGSNLSIYLMQAPRVSGGQVVGVLLLADEGRFDAEMAVQIQQGRRRPRGHLLAQTLTFQLGLLNGAQLRSGRVMRIAIHPDLQRKGFGRQLLSEVRAICCEQKFDLLGASFGATTDLLLFWQHQGVEPVLLGVGREPSSGAHAVLMLQPLSSVGALLFQQARLRGCQFLLAQLSEPLANLEAEVALLLLGQQPHWPRPKLGVLDELDLNSFSDHQRGYELTLHALKPLVCWGLLNHQSVLGERRSTLLLHRVLQQRSVGESVQLGGLTGRKQLILALRESVQVLLALWRGSEG